MSRCFHRFGRYRCPAKAVEVLEIQGECLALCWRHYGLYVAAFPPTLTLASGS